MRTYTQIRQRIVAQAGPDQIRHTAFITHTPILLIPSSICSACAYVDTVLPYPPERIRFVFVFVFVFVVVVVLCSETDRPLDRLE